jgi:hypothetical protein
MSETIDDTPTGAVKYPSTELAYEFVQFSYNVAISRLQAIDSKIQGLLTSATAITVAVPVFAKAIGVGFSSRWFYMAVVAYIMLVVIGVSGMRIGKVKVIDLKKLYNQWLQKDIWQFKKDGIFFAGEDFDDNKRLIDKKSLFRDIMAVVLLGEILCIVRWVVTTGQFI